MHRKGKRVKLHYEISASLAEISSQMKPGVPLRQDMELTQEIVDMVGSLYDRGLEDEAICAAVMRAICQ